MAENDPRGIFADLTQRWLVKVLDRIILDPVRFWKIVDDNLDVLSALAADTDARWDDAVVGAMKTALASESARNVIHTLIVQQWTAWTQGEELVMSAVDPWLVAEADKAKIDPATIIAIITAVMELLKLWRERRANQ